MCTVHRSTSLPTRAYQFLTTAEHPQSLICNNSNHQQEDPLEWTNQQRRAETRASLASTPQPLVALDFTVEDVGPQRVANTGTSATTAPSAVIINCSISIEVPPGSPPASASLDLGADVNTRHVVELPADKAPFHGGLAGASAFTVTGWINIRDASM